MTINNILEQISKIPKEYYNSELIIVSDLQEPLELFDISLDLARHGVYLVNDYDLTRFITCPESEETAKELDIERWPKLYSETRPVMTVKYEE